MPAASGSRSVQRILFPLPGDESARSLYYRAEHDAVTWDRSSITLGPGATASLASYFAAFPAGYWRARTGVERVSVVADFSGAAVVRVCAADESVGRRVVAETAVDGAFSWELRLGDGTWFWLEVDAGPDGTTMRDAAWLADEVATATATVCITTHNRTADCVGVLERLAADDLVRGQIERVIVVDQGDRPLRDEPGFDAAAAALGDRLRVIEQANLGGSGGFSRGMIESLDGSARYALLLDDDVLLEPESIRRMLAFAARAEGETIVGAHMLSLVDRTLLHSVGERVQRRGFWWTSVEPTLAPVDLATAAIETTPELRRVHDVDFNGWWMCLVPLGLVRRVGAALPLFIKWDDAEFGLRAAADGVSTVTLPGAALWHMPWTGKDDGLDWQAYFQLRNRVVTALMHSASQRGGGVLSASFAQDVNHLLCMQYGSAAARRVALRDVLDGPDHLPRTIGRRTADMRALMVRAGQIVVAEERLPASRGVPAAGAPVGALGAVIRMGHVLCHQLTRSRTAPATPVDATMARSQGKWWALGLLDSATVASATGKGAFVARRDRRTAARLMLDAMLLRGRLWVVWPRLAREYRAAAAELASSSSWNTLFRSDSGGVGDPHQ